MARPVIMSLRERRPHVDPAAWVADSAVVVGDVVIGPEASLWFHAVVRGDVERVRIGARTNVQDNATVHVTKDRWPAILGDGVTVGHNAVVHGCTVGDHCLIGIGAIVLDRCVVGDDCMIGAGSLVTPGTVVEPGWLMLGSPAKPVRRISDAERAHIAQSARNYVELLGRYRDEAI